MSHPAILRIVNADKIPPNTTWRTIKKISNALGVNNPRELEDEN
jgi:hypothetical protein